MGEGGGERGPKDCTVTEDDLGLQFLTLGVEKLYYVEAQTKMLISCENQHFAYGKTKGGSPKDCTDTEDDLGLQFLTLGVEKLYYLAAQTKMLISAVQ